MEIDVNAFFEKYLLVSFILDGLFKTCFSKITI